MFVKFLSGNIRILVAIISHVSLATSKKGKNVLDTVKKLAF